MPYHTVATRDTPALVLYLLDISGSMSNALNGRSRIDHVNHAMKLVLERMIQRSTKGATIAPRYDLGIVVYSDTPADILGGVRTIAQVAQLGYPTLSPSAATDTYAAFAMAEEMVRAYLAAHAGGPMCPAPMVCHITDGEYTGADPEPVARRLMGIQTPDGPVLVENVYVGQNLSHAPIHDPHAWAGVMDPSELADEYGRKLFAMSSPLPDSYARVINESRYAIRPGARMLIPSTTPELIELAFVMSGATPTR